MNRIKLPSIQYQAVILLVVVALMPGISQAAEKYTLPEAFAAGEFGVQLRYRFEAVADDNPALEKDLGFASTLRTTMFYRSGIFRGFKVHVEFENVADLGLGTKHNNKGAGDSSNGIDTYPVIADPEITEINQVMLSYGGLKETPIQLGRMEIILDDQRFVGAVGWRQNHQSFDALRLGQRSLPRTTLGYVYLHEIHRIFGDHKPVRGNLVSASFDGGKLFQFAPYFYHLDYVKDIDAANSRSTVGIAWRGSLTPGESTSIPFQLQLASQQDTGNNTEKISALYARGDVGLKFTSLSFGAGAEILGGSAADGSFATPLATLHKFNGWADMFLNTPTSGLQDYFGSVRWAAANSTAIIIFHHFRADAVDMIHGNEIDFQATHKMSWGQGLGAKIAVYTADEFKADTSKLMLWTSYGF